MKKKMKMREKELDKALLFKQTKSKKQILSNKKQLNIISIDFGDYRQIQLKIQVRDKLTCKFII